MGHATRREDPHDSREGQSVFASVVSMAASFARSAGESFAKAAASTSRDSGGGSFKVSGSLVQPVVQPSFGVCGNSCESSLTTASVCVSNAEVEGSTPFRSTFQDPLTALVSGSFVLTDSPSSHSRRMFDAD